MIFNTVSGSRYQVDESLKQIRRINGASNPTTKQGKDGVWKKYFSISPIVEGNGVVIIWEDEAPLIETLRNHPDMVPIPITHTSNVKSIEEYEFTD